MAGETVSHRLDGKVALVTGASRGIGASCARILAQAGAKVLGTDVLVEERREGIEGIRPGGYEAAFEALDVANAGAV